MDFSLDSKSDEDFFGSLTRLNTDLENLFAFENQRSVGGEQQESLKYQPTKQTSSNAPTTNRTITASSGATVQAWQTLLAKVAYAYKEGVPVGKAGVALLQSVENEYRIIIYKAKLNVLTTCSLRADMAQVHRSHNYLQFYDDDLLCWSVYFDADANTEEFVAKLIELNIVVSEGEQKGGKYAISELEKAPENSVSIAATNPMCFKDIEKPPIVTSKPTKTALICRMAKMGQQLPKLSPAANLQNSLDATDSSDAEIISTPLATPQLKHQPTPRNCSRALAKTQPLSLSQINPYPSGAVSGAFETQFVQMMLSENRTHSSELRMNVNRLESKVEKIIDKIDLLHSSSGDKMDKEDEMLALEEKVLELKKENRKLRQTIEGKYESKPNCEQILQTFSAELADVNLANVDSLERLVGDLLKQRAAMYNKLEEWERDLAEKNVQLKTNQSRMDDEEDMLAKTIAKKSQLEEDVKSLENRLIDKEKIESDLRHQLAESNKECLEQKQQYEENKHKGTQQEEDLDSLQKRLADKEKIEKDLRHQLAEANQECLAQRQQYEESKLKEAQVNAKVRDLEEQNTKLQQTLEENSKKAGSLNEEADESHEDRLSVQQQIETVLKKTMNNLYASLATKLDNIVPVQKNAVIAIVGKTIREETLKAMDELKQK
ncbi:PREDICTED: M protein, serotype 24 [Rhagoletis zephyria]|uniref:M protein, serotype 24 n=1 Tax=Rhagoletis zephyria TaxID=28612 RepID=UPI00081183DA|nr:PREDICTED: M protein, serotype 24 [Rhagoletis zephyria]